MGLDANIEELKNTYISEKKQKEIEKKEKEKQKRQKEIEKKQKEKEKQQLELLKNDIISELYNNFNYIIYKKGINKGLYLIFDFNFKNELATQLINLFYYKNNNCYNTNITTIKNIIENNYFKIVKKIETEKKQFFKYKNIVEKEEETKEENEQNEKSNKKIMILYIIFKMLLLIINPIMILFDFIIYLKYNQNMILVVLFNIFIISLIFLLLKQNKNKV